MTDASLKLALLQIAAICRGSTPKDVQIYQIAEEAIRQHQTSEMLGPTILTEEELATFAEERITCRSNLHGPVPLNTNEKRLVRALVKALAPHFRNPNPETDTLTAEEKLDAIEAMFSAGERHLSDHFPTEVTRAMEAALFALLERYELRRRG